MEEHPKRGVSLERREKRAPSLVGYESMDDEMEHDDLTVRKRKVESPQHKAIKKRACDPKEPSLPPVEKVYENISVLSYTHTPRPHANFRGHGRGRWSSPSQRPS